ncbi:hypothetical protein K488DRAFT_51227 [Vararia minispora EC-137]|uniref:Uncharacterized protein n=1 Tax=Vararia minispora EC-137 TaxID=1314806 RepID=A0ACB8QJN5_9AGAM|nr:hypothetical protein K488DRAFT_51227 [Vararia minispora EC-137]
MAGVPFLGSRAQQGFIAASTIAAIVVLAMISITFGFVSRYLPSFGPCAKRTLPCYLALFIYAGLFELLMAFDALRLRNVIQLLGIVFFHTGMIVFAAIQVHETRSSLSDRVQILHRVEPFVIVTPCIISASLLFLIWFGYQLYYEFGWAVFRVVGANPVMKTMFRYYQIMVCLLKFDFFMFTGMYNRFLRVQLLIIVLSTDSAEFGLTIAAIPVVFVLLIACGIAVQREIKWLMAISLILMIAAETYFVFKLVRFYSPSTAAQYATTRATITTFTIAAFLLLLISFGIGLRCFADFDKGLLQPKTVGHSAPGRQSAESKQEGGEPLEPRMSIE